MRANHHDLTPMQEGMLFHSLSAPRSGVNIEQLVVLLPEDVDAPALRQAWAATLMRHAMLRVAFASDEAGRPQQQAAPTVVVEWTEADQRTLPPAADAAWLSAWLRADRARGFDLEKPPLLRFALHRLGPAQHRFVWTFHHALLDGRSYPKILEEVWATYEALRRGETPELPAPAPYADFLTWRQAQADSAAEPFWRNELKGFPAPTPLPIDRIEREARIRETGTQRDAGVHLSRETTRELHDLAAAAGVTMGTIVQGAWALLLARYSGEEDVVFGTIRAARKATVPHADDMVGPFINAVPLRVYCSAATVLRDFLQAIRARWIALRPYEQTPLVRAQAWSEIPPGGALFESLVVFETYQLEARMRALGGAWARRSVQLFEQTNYPVTLAAHGGDHLTLKLQFDPARFADATIARMLGHLRNLLEAMPAHPGSTIGQLPLLSPAERLQLVSGWNTPAQHFPPGPTLVSVFGAQAARAPERIAATCGEEVLTYRELSVRADHVADRLRALGVGPESKVGLFVERSLDLVVSILGILKSGGAYVPLDSAYPPERLAFMMEDAGLSALVTQRALQARFTEKTFPVLCVDDIGSAGGPPAVSAGSGRAARAPTAENLAYVIYTSGSTGKPKGVLVTHANVVRLFQATAHWYQFSEDDVWTLFHSCAFDFSVWELWGALLHGGKLVVVPYLVSRSPETFYALLERERVTVLNQTPSAFRQLIEADLAQPVSRQLALRTVIFGGEALEVGTLRPWFDRHGDAHPRLVNMYGITETTVHVTYRPITRADLEGGSVIGARIPDLQLYILDPQGQPAPIEVAGELYVAGDGVARGYLNRPELTAQRFVPNPFAADPAAASKLYRTGDRARYLPNGDIEYLGRLDFQVKIRGHRVELGEIEAALCQHALVRAAAVLALPDGVGGKRLAAYVVSGGEQLATHDLRDHLARRLPNYMIPAIFIWLDRIPLTENGKIDRRALPAPDLHRPEVSAAYVEPGTPLEKQLAEIWRDVLQLDRVGAKDNFFELGGNSLLLVQLLTRVRRIAECPLEIPDLFQFPSVQTLAAHLQRGRASDTAAPPPPMSDIVRRAQRQAAALRAQSAHAA